MAYRIPRGYDVNRPPYQELSEGVRPEASAVPMEAWSGLPPVRIDQLSHDPIVLDAGTIVGIATGGYAEGKLFPAHQCTGAGSILLQAHSDGATWGLSATDETIPVSTLTMGPVLPLGVVFQPIYSFMLQLVYTNYKRNESVGIVTDYLIQIPAKSAAERAIQAGELVMCVSEETATLSDGSPAEYGYGVTAGTPPLGSFEKWNLNALSLPFVVGKCFRNMIFADSSTDTTNTAFDDDVANVTLTTAGSAEFKDLARVNTVPGLGLGGSGTAGVPSWLTKAQSDANGYYHALTILVRI